VKRALAAVAALLLLAGCTGDAKDEPAPAVTTAGSPPPWTEPANYVFVMDRKCGDGPSLGRYRVTVANSEVTATERIDGRTAEGEEEIEVPTLGGMLDLAQTAIDDGADATTKFDGADGHPTEISINRAAEAAGDATCFVISEYAPRN
jgi:Family of unknown function (DUF6174)